MGPATIAIFLAIGSATWLYNKFMHITGSDTKRSVIASAILGIVIFVIFNYIFGLISSDQ